MTSRSRLIVLLISTPVILLVVVGGVLSRAMGREESYGPMKTFDEVVTLILNNYVESVEPDRIMHGAMRGLAEGLDADSRVAHARGNDVGAAEDRGPEGRRSASS